MGKTIYYSALRLKCLVLFCLLTANNPVLGLDAEILLRFR